MGRRSHTRRLALWMNGERVGTWSSTPAGDELLYDSHWLRSPQARPLSLSLPFRPGNPPLRDDAVRHYFENLLPDSPPIRERLARRFRTATTDAFDLLTEIGRDCVGALQIVPDHVDPGDVKVVEARQLDEAGVARLLRATRSSGGFADPLSELDDLRISLAGVQEKTALLWKDGQWWRPGGPTPTTHILKLPIGFLPQPRIDLRDSVDNEWLCARILATYGLPVARCHPLAFEDQRVLGVERFDRAWSADGSWLMRLPQEDMCQATGTPAHAKYEADGGPGIDRILDLLSASRRREQDRTAFFRAQLVFWLLCAPDGHAKNFSIALHAGGTFSMTPLYDVLSAYPLLGPDGHQIAPQRVCMAMALRRKQAHWRMSEIQRRHWQDVGRRHGIATEAGSDVDELIQEVVDSTPAVLDSVASKLPTDFPARVSDPILSGTAKAARRLGGAAGA